MRSSPAGLPPICGLAGRTVSHAAALATSHVGLDLEPSWLGDDDGDDDDNGGARVRC